MDCSPPGSSVHEDSPGKDTGEGCHALFQQIFPTQGSNPGLPHCRQILYHLSHHGIPTKIQWSQINNRYFFKTLKIIKWGHQGASWSSMTGVLITTGEFRHTQGWHRRMTEAETGAVSHGCHARSWKRQGRIFQRVSEGPRLCQHILDLLLQNHEGKSFCCFKAPSLRFHVTTALHLSHIFIPCSEK